MKTLFKLVFASKPRSMLRNVTRRVVVCCRCAKYRFPLPPTLNPVWLKVSTENKSLAIKV